MSRSMRNVVTASLFLATLTPLIAPRRAEALPLFAREYKVACTTCHMAFPRLNSFGMAFKQNGYRMEGEMGKPPWEKDSFPLSLIGNVGAHWTRTDADTGGGQRVTTTQSQFRQNWVEFHTAGTLAEKITFHFDNGFSEDAGVLTTGMAFLQFDDIAANGKLNVKVGIFDGEIPYISDARRTTMASYLTSWTQDNAGIELNGTSSAWKYAAGLVNSDRTQGKAGSTNLNQFENVYGWLCRDIGNSMVTGRVRLEQQDPRAAGKSASTHTQADVSAYIATSSGRFAIIPAFTYEQFEDPTFPKTVNTGMIEAIGLLNKDGKWVATGRFEDANAPSANGFESSTTTQTAFDLAYYVNPNARVGLDWTHLTVDHGGPKTDEVQAFVHVGY